VSLFVLKLEPFLRLVCRGSFLEVEGHVVLGNLPAVPFDVDSQNKVALLAHNVMKLLYFVADSEGK